MSLESTASLARAAGHHMQSNFDPARTGAPALWLAGRDPHRRPIA